MNRSLQFCWDERLPKTRQRNVSPGQNCGPNALKLAALDVTPLSPCSLPIAALWVNSGHKMYFDDLLSHQARMSRERRFTAKHEDVRLSADKTQSRNPLESIQCEGAVSVELLPMTPRVGIFLSAGTVSGSCGSIKLSKQRCPEKCNKRGGRN